MPDIMFSVGERALLQSEGYPQHNGEYEILEMITAREAQGRRPGFPTFYETHYRLKGLLVVGDRRSQYSTDIVSWRNLQKIPNQPQNDSSSEKPSFMALIRGWLSKATPWLN